MKRLMLSILIAIPAYAQNPNSDFEAPSVPLGGGLPQPLWGQPVRNPEVDSALAGLLRSRQIQADITSQQMLMQTYPGMDSSDASLALGMRQAMQGLGAQINQPQPKWDLFGNRVK